MQLSDLQHHRPTDLVTASALARQLGPGARFLAGGTDLLVDLKQRRIEAQHLISLTSVAELRGIRLDGGVLRLGASTTLSEIADSALVQSAAPALVDTVRTMAAVQIRNRATLGGNFCAAVPCADTPPTCIVSDATLRLLGPDGERSMAAAEFFVGPRQTVLKPGEILVEVRLPAASPGSGAAYHRFSRRRYTSLAVAGVAAWLKLRDGRIDQARVAMSSVAPTPLVGHKTEALLVGQPPELELFTRAGTQAAQEAMPITDQRGTIPFRRDLVDTLCRRALAQALARAQA
ncbi:MAG: xanthine dehydrogenase family protein subunit M [Pseudomonadota bacterium]